MDDQEPLVIPATAVQEAVLRWISSSGPGRRVGAGIGRAVSAFNRRRLGAVLEDDPWTPLRRPVASARVALVATGGVHLRGDPPFDPHGDGGFRAIPRTAEPGDLQITHQAYDRRDARADLNLLSLAAIAPHPGLVVDLPYRWRRETYAAITDWDKPSPALVEALDRAMREPAESAVTATG